MAVDPLRKRKICVLGSRSVGKSSLVIQFIENHFVEGYFPTIEANFTKPVKCNGVEYECDILDTAGQDEYTILNSKHAIGIHGYVLVYSVASRNSFDMIQIVHDKIVDYCGLNDIPCVIVGAKTDLTSSTLTRQVSAQDGEALAKLNKAAWIETSAKNNVNVGKVFELCLDEIEKRTPAGNPEPRGQTCTIM